MEEEFVSNDSQNYSHCLKENVTQKQFTRNKKGSKKNSSYITNNNYHYSVKPNNHDNHILQISEISEKKLKGKEQNYKIRNNVALIKNQDCCTKTNVIKNKESRNITNNDPFLSNISSGKLKIPSKSSDLPWNLEEQKINLTQEICENKTNTIEGECTSNEMSKTREEIIQLRKIKVAARKKEKKLAIKQQKKEENSKKLVAQKYKGVTLVNNPEVGNNFVAENQSASIPTLSDFPCLGTTYNKKKTVKYCVDHIPEKEKKGKPKKMDPISLNIFEAINSRKIEKKPVTPIKKVKLRNPVISGNILDSDNPQRKRGKVRLGKKSKPSRLKAYILKIRQGKLSKNNSSSVSFNETKELLLTNEEKINFQYLLNVTSFKHPESLECVRGTGEAVDSDIKPQSQIATDINITKTLHSRRFREYCNNTLSPTLVESVCNLLTTIVKFQDRQYAKDPIKAHAKRRYVTGLRESEKYLKLGKVKLLVIAPDLEKVPGEHGLDAIVLRLKEEAQRKFVPYVFGPNRKRLGYCTFKKQKISAVAILKFEGAETQFTEVVSYLNEAREKYKTLVDGQKTGSECEIKDEKSTANVDQSNDVQREIISSFLEKLRINNEDTLAFGT